MVGACNNIPTTRCLQNGCMTSLVIGVRSVPAHTRPLCTRIYILGRCLQHRGGEPEQAKGAVGMQLFALDCIAHIVDAEMDQVFACMNDM